ncbi:MAG: nitroreductase family protein [Alistipes sp.]|nr:nitroreductase family protein [Alistipes sp.]
MILLEAIRRRWSPRSYRPDPVTREQLMLLFEAARWAPSSNNAQSWFYRYTTSDHPEAHARLAECLTGGNRAWAPQAPVLIVSCGRKFFPGTRTFNRHWMHDVGAANLSLALQATALGMQLHQMAGFDLDACSRLLGLDTEAEEPVTMMALGYPGAADALPEPFRSRELLPRTRKETDSFVELLR